MNLTCTFQQRPRLQCTVKTFIIPACVHLPADARVIFAQHVIPTYCSVPTCSTHVTWSRAVNTNLPPTLSVYPTVCDTTLSRDMWTLSLWLTTCV